MHVRRADEVDGRPMQMDGAEGVTMRLLVGRDDGAASFAMRHFSVESSGCTPRHSHDYEHEVYVLEGTGRIEQAGEFRDLRSGDLVYVQPNNLHQFVNTGDGLFRFLCLVPVTFDCGKPTPGS